MRARQRRVALLERVAELEHALEAERAACAAERSRADDLSGKTGAAEEPTEPNALVGVVDDVLPGE